MWMIIIRALISWVNPDPYNPIVQFLQRITDPVLYQIRKRLGMGSMGFDFSPIIAILLIMVSTNSCGRIFKGFSASYALGPVRGKG